MASLKFVVRLSQVKIDGKCRIYNRLCIGHDTAFVKTAYNIEPKYMTESGAIASKYPNYAKLNTDLNLLMNEHMKILESFGPDVDKTDIHVVVDRLRNKDTHSDFLKYSLIRIAELRAQDRQSYAASYEVTITHLKGYIKKESLAFTEITPSFLDKFTAYLRIRGTKLNTQRIYLNNIRAIFNNALDREVINIPTPFRRFKVKQEVNKKKPVTIIELQKLMIGPYLRAQQRSVDLFFLSFYFMGMNLKDLVNLTKKDIQGDYLLYRRAKLKEKQRVDLRIKILPEAQEIVNKYAGEKLLLRFMESDNSYLHYKNLLKETNKRLRMAGEHAGVKTRLTLGLARNTWATLAIKIGISKSDIDICLAHNLTSMTDNYIDYDQLYERVDRANDIVTSTLKK